VWPVTTVAGTTHPPMVKDGAVGVIRTELLTKSFGGSPALADLDLEVEAGEVFGYLGPNGSGKTTTIRLLLGLIRPSAGRAEVLGGDPRRDAVSIHRRLAYVPGEASLWPGLTGAETLHLLGRLSGSVDVAYRDQLVERFEVDPSKRVRAYSKGNRQKLSLVAALMTRAELLLLDEPTAGLDPLMEQVFRECVREAQARGQTVFLSSHILAEVEATFDGRPAPDARGVPGVSRATVEGATLRCQVHGSVTPLLALLADAGATRLVSREPTLEQLFLTFYGEVPDERTSG